MEEQRFGSDRAYEIVTQPTGAARWVRKAIRRTAIAVAVVIAVFVVLLAIGSGGAFLVDCCEPGPTVTTGTVEP